MHRSRKGKERANCSWLVSRHHSSRRQGSGMLVKNLIAAKKATTLVRSLLSYDLFDEG